MAWLDSIFGASDSSATYGAIQMCFDSLTELSFGPQV